MSARALVVLVALNTSFGCATTPPPSRLTSESSVIGISVKVRAFKLISSPQEWVYFVRLDAGDLGAQEEVIPSNYSQGNYVYLVNAEPGRYAAVAASRSRQSSTGPMGIGGGFSVSVSITTQDTTYFSRELIEKTSVTVGPGSVAFMGNLVVDRSGFGDAAPVQLHYLRLLAPKDEEESFLEAMMKGKSYKGAEYQVDQSQKALQKFLNRTRTLMAETDWARVLQNPVGAAPRD